MFLLERPRRETFASSWKRNRWKRGLSSFQTCQPAGNEGNAPSRCTWSQENTHTPSSPPPHTYRRSCFTFWLLLFDRLISWRPGDSRFSSSAISCNISQAEMSLFQDKSFFKCNFYCQCIGAKKGENICILFYPLVLLFVVPSCAVLESPLPQLLSSSFFFFSSPMSSSRGAFWFDRGDPESRLPRKLPEPADVLLADQCGEGLQHHFVLWTLPDRKGVWHPGDIWWWVLGSLLKWNFLVFPSANCSPHWETVCAHLRAQHLQPEHGIAQRRHRDPVQSDHHGPPAAAAMVVWPRHQPPRLPHQIRGWVSKYVSNL